MKNENSAKKGANKSIVQALNLAYASELGGARLYGELALKGYDKGEFSSVETVRLKGCALLKQAAASYGVSLPDDAGLPVFAPDKFDDALIVAINYEISIVALYDSLCEQCDDDVLRDLFFRLWATSQNEFTPALKSRLYQALSGDAQGAQNESLEPKNELFGILKGDFRGYQDEINSLNQKLSRVVNGEANESEIKELLNHKQFAFFSGAALGAVGLSAIMKNLNKDEKNDE